MYKNTVILIVLVISLNFFLFQTTYATNENDYEFDSASGKIIRYIGNSDIVTIPSSINGINVKSKLFKY